MTKELWRWTATDLAEAIRTRTVSSREVVASCIERIATVNPTVNAVVEVFEDEAFEAADCADRQTQRSRNPVASLGPLHGVPVAVKVNVDFAGLPTTNGSPSLLGVRAEEHSAPVRNLLSAGAVIVGRTNVPDFSKRYYTESSLYGRTMNPWDASRSPGGSSGGSAAAVATGMCPIAHGNDRAGSIRDPAYSCGVVGLRPTLGFTSTHNPSSEVTQGIAGQLSSVEGVLARSVDDVRLGLIALMKPHARDPWWRPFSLVDDATLPLRVGLVLPPPDTNPDASVITSVRAAGESLASAGCEVDEVSLPNLAEAASLFWRLTLAEERVRFDGSPSTFMPTGGTGGEKAQAARTAVWACVDALSYREYVEALTRRTVILQEWLALLEDLPLLVLPSSWKRPALVDSDLAGESAMRDVLVAHEPMTAISILGLPSLAVPTGLDDAGLPMGVQLVGAPGADAMCLAAGLVVERALSIGTPIDPSGT